MFTDEGHFARKGRSFVRVLPQLCVKFLDILVIVVADRSAISRNIIAGYETLGCSDKIRLSRSILNASTMGLPGEGERDISQMLHSRGS